MALTSKIFQEKFLLPLIKIPGNELITYYQSWIKIITSHSSTPLRFDTIYRRFYILHNSIEPFIGIISLGVLAVLYSIAVYKHKLFKQSFLHRVQFLGILMIWAILFGTSSKRNTYHIAIVGYALCYLCFQPINIDKIFLWINFMLLEIVPIDIFCPRKVAIFLLDSLNLGIIVFSITWSLLVYKIIKSNLDRSSFQTIEINMTSNLKPEE